MASSHSGGNGSSSGAHTNAHGPSPSMHHQALQSDFQPPYFPPPFHHTTQSPPQQQNHGKLLMFYSNYTNNIETIISS